MSGRSATSHRTGAARSHVLRGLGNRVFVAIVSVATLVAVAAVTVGVVRALVRLHGAGGQPAASSGRKVVVRLPAKPLSYLGAYAQGVPQSYEPMQQFATHVGVQPNLALYYSGWGEPFKTNFAMQAARNHAVPLIQIEPGRTKLAAIANGGYTAYLTSFAKAVKAFGHRTNQGVIIGFAHEPNGRWYPWGDKKVSPQTWVAAWRRVWTTFHDVGADNVTWLWTINVFDTSQHIADPTPWWPGPKYVTWVGIDGYYYKPTWSFAPLFGPAIKAVRGLTGDPILISETGASPAAGKAAKIANLFAGVKSYQLLGLVWFDRRKHRDWRIEVSPSAITAFRAGASEFTLVRP
ncbi:MAG: glycoside hydrolase family 26 protein [Streptosporangiaceae bacterium]